MRWAPCILFLNASSLSPRRRGDTFCGSLLRSERFLGIGAFGPSTCVEKLSRTFGLGNGEFDTSECDPELAFEIGLGKFPYGGTTSDDDESTGVSFWVFVLFFELNGPGLELVVVDVLCAVVLRGALDCCGLPILPPVDFATKLRCRVAGGAI